MADHDVNPDAHTVDELSDEIESVDDPETLKEMYEAETEQQDRTGAKEIIETRLEEQTTDEEADSIEKTRDTIERSLGAIEGSDEENDRSNDESTSSIEEIQKRVRDQLPDLINQPLDSIIEVEQDDEEWRIVVEFIERRAVPDTQDILGRYEVRLGGDGQIRSYRRLNRYRRDDTTPME